jgi:hypothetical protein
LILTKKFFSSFRQIHSAADAVAFSGIVAVAVAVAVAIAVVSVGLIC